MAGTYVMAVTEEMLHESSRVYQANSQHYGRF